MTAGSASFALHQSLVTPVLPTIQTEFHTSQNTVTWVLTANLLSAAIFTPLAGRVGDAAGKHRALVAVLLALAAGSALAAVAPNIGVLLAARAVQGAAGAVFPLSYGIIRDEFPPARVASGVGAISAVIAAGGGLGLVLAGPVVDVLGYAWLFWFPAIFGAGTAVAAFLVVDVVAARPFIAMRMMRSPVVWTTNLVALLFGAGQFAVFAFLPQFVQTSPDAGYGFGSTVTQAGLLLLPMLAAMFVSGLVSGRVERVFGSRAQLVAGVSVAAVAAALAVPGRRGAGCSSRGASATELVPDRKG
ncbi:MFS transporter [Actinomadura syzygii]|uniref:MFS transporter n=1 Tax=Actinomadura syzygii TaxID=1427538 RepID=UPI001CA34380|nr:MFS transporter [Actinomadura syzygii]